VERRSPPNPGSDDQRRGADADRHFCHGVHAGEVGRTAISEKGACRESGCKRADGGEHLALRFSTKNIAQIYLIF
jgi:hypothetical protein